MCCLQFCHCHVVLYCKIRICECTIWDHTSFHWVKQQLVGCHVVGRIYLSKKIIYHISSGNISVISIFVPPSHITMHLGEEKEGIPYLQNSKQHIGYRVQQNYLLWLWMEKRNILRGVTFCDKVVTCDRSVVSPVFSTFRTFFYILHLNKCPFYAVYLIITTICVCVYFRSCSKLYVT